MTKRASVADIGEMATMSWRALGTTAVIRAPRRSVMSAYRAVGRVVEQVDALASRFRDDSELSRVNARSGHWTRISPELLDLIDLGLWAAAVSDGLVDPTLAHDLERLGYDHDFAQLACVEPEEPLVATASRPGDRGQPWRLIRLDHDAELIRIPAGIALDLGATAKGRAADLAAVAAFEATGREVLVSLGGDISVAGPVLDDGWTVAIAQDHQTNPSDCETAVTIRSGGLATSSLTVRRWMHDGEAIHHILDPRSGEPVAPAWTVASVTAATCAEANIAATAALVLGEKAPQWLQEQNLPARLVGVDGLVTHVAGWPA